MRQLDKQGLGTEDKSVPIHQCLQGERSILQPALQLAGFSRPP